MRERYRVRLFGFQRYKPDSFGNYFKNQITEHPQITQYHFPQPPFAWAGKTYGHWLEKPVAAQLQNRHVGSDRGEHDGKRGSIPATLGRSIRGSSIRGSSNDFIYDSSWAFIRDDLLLATMDVQRLFVLQSELIQHGRLEVVRGHDVLDRSVPKLIGLTESHAGLEPTTSHPNAKALAVVITSRFLG